jgi:hypothetical protein
MTDLANLLARVEKAEGGSRELDALIEVAVRWEQAARAGLQPEHRATWRANRSGQVGDGHTTYNAEPVSASLDAALGLCERVLPGCCVENLGEMRPGCGELSGHWLAQLAPRQDRRRMSGPITVENVRATLDAYEPASAATAPLALLAACLRALLAQQTPQTEEEKA